MIPGTDIKKTIEIKWYHEHCLISICLPNVFTSGTFDEESLCPNCIYCMIKFLYQYVKSTLLVSSAFYIFVLCQLTGCVSPQKLIYFQRGTTSGDTLAITSPYIPTIRSGDIISVQVTSLNPEASNFFNPYSSIASIDRNTGGTATVSQSPGYLVATDGKIELPLIGKLTVAGLTTAQAGDRIREELKAFLKEPTVNVRNMNFRISVLGEVVRPSLFTIQNEQITLPEALSLAGDVTIYGRRDNIMLIREIDGKRTFNRLDLTRRDVFNSPFYYLHPNDIVYVEPGKARVASTDRAYQVVPIVLSALSFLAILATQLLNN